MNTKMTLKEETSDTGAITTRKKKIKIKKIRTMKKKPSN